MVDKGQKPVTVDMSDAKTFEMIPAGINLRLVVSKWEIGKTEKGNVVHAGLTALEPAIYKGRNFRDDISLENEYTKGRCMVLLMAALEKTEKEIRVKGYQIPDENTMVGKQLAATTGIQQPKEDSQYGPKQVLNRYRVADKYTENYEEILAKVAEQAEKDDEE